MPRKPFGQQDVNPMEVASRYRSLEENTGATEEWKPQAGNRTKEAGGWGGTGYYYEDRGFGNMPVARPGSRQSDEDVERYRQKGAERRPAIQLDAERMNRAQPMQYGSLALLSQAAAGNAPSRAAELGRLSTEDANRTAAGAAIGRGAGGSVRATRGAIGGLGAQGARSAMAAGDMRAGEMGQARGEYAGGASTARRQDIGIGVTNAKLDAANRDLEAKRQQQFEKLAWDTRNAEMFGMVEQRALEEQKQIQERAAAGQEEAQREKEFWDTTTAGGGFLTGMMSDVSTKRGVPYGSLAPLAAKVRK